MIEYGRSTFKSLCRQTHSAHLQVGIAGDWFCGSVVAFALSSCSGYQSWCQPWVLVASPLASQAEVPGPLVAVVGLLGSRQVALPGCGCAGVATCNKTLIWPHSKQRAHQLHKGLTLCLLWCHTVPKAHCLPVLLFIFERLSFYLDSSKPRPGDRCWVLVALQEVPWRQLGLAGNLQTLSTHKPPSSSLMSGAFVLVIYSHMVSSTASLLF